MQPMVAAGARSVELRARLKAAGLPLQPPDVAPSSRGLLAEYLERASPVFGHEQCQ